MWSGDLVYFCKGLKHDSDIIRGGLAIMDTDQVVLAPNDAHS